MTYRSDADSLAARRHALEGELKVVRKQLADLDPLASEEKRLERELAEARRLEEGARARRPLPVLESITVPTRCTEDWEGMRGDDKIRHCFKCQKNVYNLSAMTREEAQNLLESRQDLKTCVRFFRRVDGTVVTSDCGKRRRRGLAILAGAAAAVGGVGGAAAMSLSGSNMSGATEREFLFAPAVMPPDWRSEPIQGGATPMMGEPVIEMKMGETAVEELEEFKGDVAIDPRQLAQPPAPTHK